MSIVYSHRGFPVIVSAANAGSVFESPEVEQLFLARNHLNGCSFEEELKHVVEATRVWTISGGMFSAVLNPEIVVSPAVKSFIAETALLLRGEISRRRVGFADWAMLLAPAEGVVCGKPAFTPAELEAVKTLADMLKPEFIIQRWIQVAGLDDLIRSLYLFVGPVTSTATTA